MWHHLKITWPMYAMIVVLVVAAFLMLGCQASWKDGGGQRFCIGSNPQQPCEALDEPDVP